MRQNAERRIREERNAPGTWIGPEGSSTPLKIDLAKSDDQISQAIKEARQNATTNLAASAQAEEAKNLKGPLLVYRALKDGENPSLGLFARDPGANILPESHVRGRILSQWISTTYSPLIAGFLEPGGRA